MKLIIFSNCGLRKDSTSLYFVRAFRTLLGESNVRHIESLSELEALQGGEADHFIKIDDGQHWQTFNKRLHPSSYYVIDTHIETDWRLKQGRDYAFDNVFVAHKQGLGLGWHTPNVSWVPVGCEPESHYVGQREKRYDIAHIGMFHSNYADKRIEYVDAIFKAFPNFYFSSGTKFFKEMTEKYAESRIVFNKPLNGDLNMRFFEGMASGSALLSEWLPEAKDLGFRSDIDYISYQNKEEAIDKAKFYLDRPNALEDIARSGKQYTHDNHTYKHRAEQILEVITKERVLNA